MAAVRESVLEQRKLWKESVQFCLEEVQKAGVEVVYPEKEPFQNQVEPLYDQFRNDPVMSDLIKQIQEL